MFKYKSTFYALSFLVVSAIGILWGMSVLAGSDRVKPTGIGGGIGRPAPILALVRIENGKNVCAKENDKPKKSDRNPSGQIDGECCLDPDEIPNSNCYYDNPKYDKYLKKYLNGQKR